MPSDAGRSPRREPAHPGPRSPPINNSAKADPGMADLSASGPSYTGYSGPGYISPVYSSPGYSSPGYIEPVYSGPGYMGPVYNGPGDNQLFNLRQRPRSGYNQPPPCNTVQHGVDTCNYVNSDQCSSTDYNQFVTPSAGQYGLDNHGHDFVSAIEASTALGHHQSGLSQTKSSPEQSAMSQFDVDNPGSRFECSLCFKSYKYKKDRRRHIMTAHEEGPQYNCKCGHRGSRKDNYTRHVDRCRSAKTGGRYQCKCGDETPDKNSHNQHLKSCKCPQAL
ncbi:hypothetical protein F5B19DRAFT_119248 [Rostrohypoxylon terebratum]|nr:hypothetical protein F5B19DRAFT_119248 [Rostrohypoxylon terebratum]